MCTIFNKLYKRCHTDLMLGLQNILKERAMIIEVFFLLSSTSAGQRGSPKVIKF